MEWGYNQLLEMEIALIKLIEEEYHLSERLWK